MDLALDAVAGNASGLAKTALGMASEEIASFLVVPEIISAVCDQKLRHEFEPLYGSGSADKRCGAAQLAEMLSVLEPRYEGVHDSSTMMRNGYSTTYIGGPHTMIIASAGMSMTYIHGTRIPGNGDGHVSFPIGPPWKPSAHECARRAIMRTQETRVSSLNAGLSLLMLVSVFIGLLVFGDAWASHDLGRFSFSSLQSTVQAEPSGVAVGIGDVTTDVRSLIAVEVCGMAVAPDGIVWGWGDSYWGQLLLKWGNWCRRPRPIPGLPKAKAVSIGISKNLLLGLDESVWTWGDYPEGNWNRSQPRRVAGLPPMSAIDAGGGHCMALTSEGVVWTWGGNRWGQLGDGSTATREVPQPVAGLSGVVDISAGCSHSLALCNDGSVWAWGDFVGAEADAESSGSPMPSRVEGLPRAVRVEAGAGFSMALTADGEVWMWGASSSSLARVSDEITMVPSRVQGLPPAIGISAGAGHCLVVTADGTVWAWGDNSFGVLGDGTEKSRATPKPVPGISGAVAVAAGLHLSACVTSDGSVWEWGLADRGLLGDYRGCLLPRKVRVPLLTYTRDG